MKTILIVDDDPIIRQCYAELLGDAGYTVISCPDGQSALLAIHEGLCADLIITDYRMPGMNGLELIEQLRKYAPRIPVIMCSLYMRPDVYVKALSLGVTEYLEKPFRLNELKRVVATALEAPAKGPYAPGLQG
jgi:CheY-like chemotaxis protein